MPKYTVESVFERVLGREMKVIIEEKEKSCQSGAVIDLATDRLVEAYFLMNSYKDMKRRKEFENGLYESEKAERKRYEELLRKEREK